MITGMRLEQILIFALLAAVGILSLVAPRAVMRGYIRRSLTGPQTSALIIVWRVFGVLLFAWATIMFLGWLRR